MNSPMDWLLVIECEDGSWGYINLWQAIAESRLVVKINPLNRARVRDACADTGDNRQDIEARNTEEIK